MKNVDQLRTSLNKRAAETERKLSSIIRELVPDITEWRRQGHSWRVIAGWLSAEGVSITPTALSVMFRRESERTVAQPTAMASPSPLAARLRQDKGFQHKGTADLKGLV